MKFHIKVKSRERCMLVSLLQPDNFEPCLCMLHAVPLSLFTGKCSWNEKGVRPFFGHKIAPVVTDQNILVLSFLAPPGGHDSHMAMLLGGRFNHLLESVLLDSYPASIEGQVNFVVDNTMAFYFGRPNIHDQYKSARILRQTAMLQST